MKYLVKKSVLLLLVVLAFCACDNSNDNGEVIQPNPHPQSSKTVVNYTGEVEYVVDAPQIREDIEQDLKANPPFGGSKKYQFIIKRYSRLLPASYMLYAVNPEDDKSADGYILDIAGEVEYKDNYRLFPVTSGLGWYKENIVPVDTKDGKPVATYDVFIQTIPTSTVVSKMYFCEDLTEKYRQKFPNEDIHAVVRRLVLSYVSVGDNIKE